MFWTPIHKNIQTEVLVGIDGLNAVAVDDAVDIVMSAIVGAICLEPTLCAVDRKSVV